MTKSGSNSAKSVFSEVKDIFTDSYKRNALLNKVKKVAINILWFLIIVGVSYVILAPVIGMVVNSISSDRDAYDPMMFVLPKQPTLEKYKLVFERLDYATTMSKDLVYVALLTIIQLFICSMVGYGFARFDFPLKGLLFGCVVVMIVIPTHVIMFPLYITFRQFDPFGLATRYLGDYITFMGTPAPMFIMSFLGTGLKSGLYIYIFNQFFRGLPKEIEEAALVDGCGAWYTYFRIMLPNAMPSVITVTVFSLVWQFNDTFYSNLFQISPEIVISKKISTLQATIANIDKILDLPIQELYLDAGIVLMILPILLIYLLLQKQFIEGVERSGIVG